MTRSARALLAPLGPSAEATRGFTGPSRTVDSAWCLGNTVLALAFALGYHLVSSPSPAADLVAYGLSLPCLVAHCALYRVWFRPTFWFLLAYLALFFVNPIVFAFAGLLGAGTPFAHPPEVVGTYHALTLAGIHLFLAGQAAASCLGRGGAPPRVRAQFSGRATVAVYAFFGVQLLACLLFVVDQGGVGALFSFSRVTLQLGRSVLSLSGVYLIYFTLPLFFLLPAFWKKRVLRLCFSVLFVLLINAVVFLAFRIRTIFLATLVAFVSGWIFREDVAFPQTRRPFRERSRKRRMVLAVFALVGIALIGVTSRFLRGQLEGTTYTAVGFQDLGRFIYVSVEGGDFGYTPVVLDLISMVPREQPYLLGQSYWRFLLAPVPRTFMPEKPENTERIVASWLAPGLEGMTIPPGITGDLYINFGVLGIVGMTLWGAFFRGLDHIRGFCGLLFASAAFPGIFHLARGSFTNSVLILGTIYFGSYVLARILRGEYRDTAFALWRH